MSVSENAAVTNAQTSFKIVSIAKPPESIAKTRRRGATALRDNSFMGLRTLKTFAFGPVREESSRPMRFCNRPEIHEGGRWFRVAALGRHLAPRHQRRPPPEDWAEVLGSDLTPLNKHPISIPLLEDDWELICQALSHSAQHDASANGAFTRTVAGFGGWFSTSGLAEFRG
jgi:hypothetical protein